LLKRLPVGAIKIDRSFVMELPDDAGAATIVRSTVELGHGLGLTVIAEGVEHEAAWDHLVACDCDQIQGYAISRPVPAPQLEAWLGSCRPAAPLAAAA
jgi:EAL domain-containing protein (putative c-di-GMP-specific phosphodiesterase class I)